MLYTVKHLADLAGVSPRTLRYYDKIGLLVSSRSINGYRIYDQAAIDRLQLILFYRSLGIPLSEIGRIIDDPGFNVLEALEAHHQTLIEEQSRLAERIRNVEKTIQSKKGEVSMSNEEKFEGFKRAALEKNESEYGQELRNKYGEKVIKQSNKKWMSMTQQDKGEMKALEQELIEVLKAGTTSHSPADDLYRRAAKLHKAWLMYSWTEYSEVAHKGLAEMYLQDPRFNKYYEDIAPGAASFLRDAIVEHM
ncbi:MerR family transcriptional regulator [Salinicoccus sesuvii]|uniref:MerR family transcriptional regulator n=1 Tax=Salinicoccus sesuvii TaxID=868281 RepID=A0ABV7N799_9STAP